MHNVSQSDASENYDVTSDLAIEVGKDSRRMDISQINGFINLDESS